MKVFRLVSGKSFCLEMCYLVTAYNFAVPSQNSYPVISLGSGTECLGNHVSLYTFAILTPKFQNSKDPKSEPTLAADFSGPHKFRQAQKYPTFRNELANGCGSLEYPAKNRVTSFV